MDETNLNANALVQVIIPGDIGEDMNNIVHVTILKDVLGCSKKVIHPPQVLDGNQESVVVMVNGESQLNLGDNSIEDGQTGALFLSEAGKDDNTRTIADKVEITHCKKSSKEANKFHNIVVTDIYDGAEPCSDTKVSLEGVYNRFHATFYDTGASKDRVSDNLLKGNDRGSVMSRVNDDHDICVGGGDNHSTLETDTNNSNVEIIATRDSLGNLTKSPSDVNENSIVLSRVCNSVNDRKTKSLVAVQKQSVESENCAAESGRSSLTTLPSACGSPQADGKVVSAEHPDSTRSLLEEILVYSCTPNAEFTETETATKLLVPETETKLHEPETISTSKLETVEKSLHKPDSTFNFPSGRSPISPPIDNPYIIPLSVTKSDSGDNIFFIKLNETSNVHGTEKRDEQADVPLTSLKPKLGNNMVGVKSAISTTCEKKTTKRKSLTEFTRKSKSNCSENVGFGVKGDISKYNSNSKLCLGHSYSCRKNKMHLLTSKTSDREKNHAISAKYLHTNSLPASNIPRKLARLSKTTRIGESSALCPWKSASRKIRPHDDNCGKSKCSLNKNTRQRENSYPKIPEHIKFVNVKSQQSFYIASCQENGKKQVIKCSHGGDLKLGNDWFRQTKSKPYNYMCNTCNIKFPCQKSWIFHMKVLHDNKLKFLCKHCKKTFGDVDQFRAHLHQHTVKMQKKMYGQKRLDVKKQSIIQHCDVKVRNCSDQLAMRIGDKLLVPVSGKRRKMTKCDQKKFTVCVRENKAQSSKGRSEEKVKKIVYRCSQCQEYFSDNSELMTHFSI